MSHNLRDCNILNRCLSQNETPANYTASLFFSEKNILYFTGIFIEGWILSHNTKLASAVSMPTFELSTLCTSISICVYAIVTVHGMASQVYYRCRKPCKGPYYYTIPSKPAAAAAMCNASGSHDCLGRSSRSRSHTALPACKKNLTCSQSLAAPNHSKAKKSTFVSI